MSRYVYRRLFRTTDGRSVLHRPEDAGRQEHSQVEERLATVGLKLSGITTDLSNRGKEILKWLEEHPDTTNFVILDDEYHNFKSCGLKNNLVKTDFSTGLREVHIEKAIKILNQNV